MIDFIVKIIAKFLFWLRYDIRLICLDKITEKGKTGIVFLPNHPALIDPIIMFAYLHGPFAPHGFGDYDQVNRPLIRFFARRWGVRTIQSIAHYGPAAKAQIEQALDETIDGLKHGDNLILWPAGQVYRGCRESLGANSSVERILKNCPNIRIVLVRTRGLWGSGFSWASGKEPLVVPTLLKGVLGLLASGIFFAPRRKITIEFYEPADLPREADRNTFNRYLEDFYNADTLPNTYVPHSIWEKGGTRVVPEPTSQILNADYSAAPPATRQIILKHLADQTGISKLKDTDSLAADLGMDSLARTDLLLWLEKEFGFSQPNADAMRTVGDVMLAACGKFVYLTPTALKPVAAGWFKHKSQSCVLMPEGQTLTEIFLNQAARNPSRIIIADQTSGVKSYRDIITACLAFRPLIKKLEGDHVGIMLPAAVASDVIYLAALFSEKIPVMVNWTAGVRNIVASLDAVGVKYILTSKTLVDRIALQGIDLSAISSRFCFLEEFRTKISRAAKLTAWLTSHISWSSLRKIRSSEMAVILFTSGSETLPKAVPLSHANLIANMRAVLSVIKLYETDRLIGFLPPFHSFGLTVTMLLPLLAGAQAIYTPNPNEPDTLAKIIDAYKVTLFLGTPTFVAGILRVANEKQLASVRLAVTGAEKCPQTVYDALGEKCKQAVILEGYGVTECSPIISINDENNPQHFSIGKILPGLEFLLIHPETERNAKLGGVSASEAGSASEPQKPLTPPATGLLLVHGPSVFSGYLNYSGKSPFTEIDGKQWYNTGDLVCVDQNGLMTFQGRLKRFVKLGGEMISLPAIEAILESVFAPDSNKGPLLAVEAADVENPEIVLFTTLDIDRENANIQIRKAGLSGLHSIRRVIKLDQIPLLGTGKTDYRTLKEMLKTV